MRRIVTSGNRITIPKVMRDKFKMTPGTKVEFVMNGNDILIQKVVDTGSDPSSAQQPK